MEKLQIAIEQARQRREGTKDRNAKSVNGKSAGAKQGSPARNRPAARLLPDGLMERWEALAEFKLPSTDGDARRLVAHQPGPEASHYDVLRTKILIELRKHGWRRIAVTSPTAGCGKTTTACNLALSLARQGELRTCLFDLDLRRPGVAHILGTHPETDISDLLRGTTDFNQQAMRLGSNLAVSMAQRPQSDPTRLLAGKRAGEVMDEIEQQFAPDVMIFDLPPVLIADDARTFLRNVDCALILARAEHTTARDIDVSEREIAEQTNVLGVVLNECRFDEGHRNARDYG